MDADVIVMGAGAAGLSAARALADSSLRVIVVEARDRIGGRAWSRPVTPGGVHAELGAEFIHGPAKETRALLRDIGKAAFETGGDSWIRSERGTLQRRDDTFVSAARILERARSLATDESVNVFLERFTDDEAKRDTVRMARTFVEGFEAADPAIASARAIADELRSGTDSFSARPEGGYAPIFDHLYETCIAAGAEISRSTVVSRVAWERGAVDVHARRHGRTVALRARAAVVTLPIGVLKHTGDATDVAFEPNLAESKREALDFLEMGHVVKVMLAFRRPFWLDAEGARYRDAGFFRAEGQPFNAYWTQWPVRSPLIAAWIGGPTATAMSDSSPSQLIERARTGFAALFDDATLARREFAGGLMHDWGHDPFARGAYSYVTVGGGDARAILGAPLDDTLFFAGEATSTDGQGGTVNGAFETGERAARQVAASLGIARDKVAGS